MRTDTEVREDMRESWEFEKRELFRLLAVLGGLLLAGAIVVCFIFAWSFSFK